MGTLFVDKLDPQSGTSLELGSSGDTVSVNTGATTNLAGNVTLGASGKTITVPSGATIANSGTATGFGEKNTPHWEVGLSSDQSIPNSTMTKLQFNVDRKNASGSPDYWDNSNYRTQNLTAGDYFAYLNLTFEGNAGSSTAYILIKRYNSSNVEQQSSGKALDQWTKQGQYHGSIFSVATGDYIAYELWQNSGGTVTQLYEAGDGSLCFGGGFLVATA
jgi:hypothetical protein